MENSEIKKALQQVLAEKGDYKTLSRMLADDEKRAKDEDKSNQLTKLITPISAFADILTENSKGAFMEDLEKRLDEGVAAKVTEHKDELDTALASFKTELNDLLAQSKANLTTENLQSYKDAETKLTSAMMEQAIDTVARKAAEMLPTISESARLTPDDISDIIDTAALSVESQVERIIGEYIEDFGITVDQITDFKEEVQKLIPAVDFSGISVDYSQVRNAPQGGTSAVLVNQLIAAALEGFSGGLPDQSGNNGKFLSTDGTDASWETVSAGSVDVVSNVATDRILGRTTAGSGDSEQLTASEVRTLINVADGATANTGALADLDTVDTAQIDDDAITNAKIAGAGTRDATTFYRGDGTFAAPSGSGDLVGPSSAADNSVPTYDGTTGKLVQDQGSMFIDDDGNVGIGTDSPASPLTIANAATNKAQFGTGTVNSSIKISNRMEVGYNGKGYINTPVVKNMEIRTNSIVKQIVHTTGILTSGTNYGVQFTPTVNQASGTAGFTALHVDVTETATGSGSQLLMDLQVGGSSKFVVDNAGNVGIGTTAPDTKLQVAGAITQQPLSSDPADPDAGNSVQWVSDGTGTGDAGDVMLKVNVGGTTKVITLIDYSVA